MSLVSKKELLVLIAIYIIVEIGLLIFDLTLELGQFSGLVFYIYSLYFTTLYIIFILIFMYIKRKKEKKIYS